MIEGCIDRIENNRIKGWAWDPNHPFKKIAWKKLNPSAKLKPSI